MTVDLGFHSERFVSFNPRSVAERLHERALARTLRDVVTRLRGDAGRRTAAFLGISLLSAGAGIRG